jgi:hypothetical protein
MPIARVKMPDGRVLRIRVAEGADPEQVKQMALQYHKDQSEGKLPADVAPSDAAPQVPDLEAKKAAAHAGIQQEYNRMLQEQADKQSYGKNMLIGAGQMANDNVEGLKQLLARATDDPRLAAMQDKTEADRALMEPVDTFANGGTTGKILANIAAYAIPGKYVAQGAGALGAASVAAPKLATLAALTGGEAGLGALSGALTPTTKDESLGNNVKMAAALNAIMPLGGAALRSGPSKYMADKILDYTPLFYGARRTSRNVAGKAARDAERATVKQENDALWSAYDTAAKSGKLADKQVAALRADESNAARAATLKKAQADLSAMAGWDVVPEDKLGMEAAHKAIGQKYGELIDPIPVDTRELIPHIRGLADAVSTDPLSATPLHKLANRIEKVSGDVGIMSGSMYKKLRSEITSDMRKASGADYTDLESALGKLDESFNKSIPPEQADAINTLRQQYALGSKMNRVDAAPGEGFDPLAMRRRLDTTRAAEAPRRMLTEMEKNLPPEVKARDMESLLPDYSAAPRQGLQEMPAPFQPEGSDYAKMGAILAALHYGTGGWGLAGAPLAAGVIKAANNDYVRKIAPSILRGVNTTYGAGLGPLLSDGVQ